MNKAYLTISAIILSLVASHSGADEAQIQQLKDTLSKKMPRLEISRITETPVPGVLELLTGGDIYYLTPDASFMFQGNLIDLDNEVNLTSRRKGAVHMGLINQVPEEKMVIFAPDEKPESEREMTVFTDTSCPYCSKLHAEIDQITDAGIKVRYLLYPRAGMGSPAYKELQSVWCAEDQQDAMTAAKAGQEIEEKVCENPIQEHMELARQVGLRGTPLIYLDSGEIVNGYRPADQLVQLIANSQPMSEEP